MKPFSYCELVTYDYAFEASSFPLAIKPQFNTGSPGWHQHERFYEIVLIVSGEAVHIYENKRYILKPQEIFVIPPGMYHSYEKCAFDYYNILVDFSELKLPLFDLPRTEGFQNLFLLAPRSHQSKNGEALRNFLDVEQFSQGIKLLKRMYDLQTRRKEGYQLAMVAAFNSFLQLICRAGEDLVRSEKSSNSQPHTVGELAMAMARYCQDAWPVEKMCKVSRMSRPVLFREFKKYYNTTPVKFLNDQRLRKAAALLRESDMNLEAIATACGFANGSYFSTVFKNSFKITPLKYRRDNVLKYPDLTDILQ